MPGFSRPRDGLNKGRKKVNKKTLIQLVAISWIIGTVQAQLSGSAAEENKMNWWKDANFGVLIPWGIYSVLAGTYEKKFRVPENGS